MSGPSSEGIRVTNTPDLEDICRQVLSILVNTFGFSEVEAQHRLNLFRTRQHTLEGQALEGVLPALSPEEQAQELLRWALDGEALEDELRTGAAQLGLEIDPPD